MQFTGVVGGTLSVEEGQAAARLCALPANAAASIVGCPAVIVVPKNAPQIKVENCRW